MSYTIKDLPILERPRERLAHKGAGVLSAKELLAILLGGGIKGKSALALAFEILCRFQTLENLSSASIQELTQIQGLGKAKAAQIQAALTLSWRMLQEEAIQPIYSLGSRFLFQHLKATLCFLRREVFGTILISKKGKIIRTEEIAIGGHWTVSISPQEVFQTAIRNYAHSIVLYHTHPNGNLKPSKEDLRGTKKFSLLGKQMGVPIYDKLIMSKMGFFSLRDSNAFDFAKYAKKPALVKIATASL